MISLCVCARARQRITKLLIRLLPTHSIFKADFIEYSRGSSRPFSHFSSDAGLKQTKRAASSHARVESVCAVCFVSGENFSRADDYFFDFLRTCVSKLMLRHNRTNARLTQFRAWALLCEVSKRAQFAVTSIKRQQFL